MLDSTYLRLVDAGLESHARTLADMTLPAIRLVVAEVSETDWPVGMSKLGGAPDLPPALSWPEWLGTPLGFIGQINLGDVLSFAGVAPELPGSGVLSFFYHPEHETWGYDPKDAGSFRVYWFPDASALARVALPKTVPRHARLAAGRLTMRAVTSLAPPQAIAVRELGLSQAHDAAYHRIREELDGGPRNEPRHQLLGHPTPLQDEMQLECQLVTNGINLGDAAASDDPRRAALEPGASEWRLLLQVDSDGQLDAMWGDVGMLYYWIRASDLAARDFDRAWLVLQCF